MTIAKQSTAAIFLIGPVLDADGVAVTDIAVGDLLISKNGASGAALNGSATLTHRHTGHYSLALTTSDTDTVGESVVYLNDGTNACSPLRLQVVEEAVYDALYGASAVGPLLANSNGSGLTEAGGTGDHLTAVASASDLATVDGNVDAIKAKTDNLPSDPADQSLVIAATDALATLIGDVPTNSELATALAGADDATLAAIAALNNLSSAQAQTAAAAALTAYDPPTRAEATSDANSILDRLPTSLSGGSMKAAITHVNGVAVDGAGTEEDPWGPA